MVDWLPKSQYNNINNNNWNSNENQQREEHRV